MKPVWAMTKKEIQEFCETVVEVPAYAVKDSLFRSAGEIFALDGHLYHDLNGVITHTLNLGSHRWMIDAAVLEGKVVPDEVKRDYIGIIFNKDLSYMWPELLAS